MARSMAAPCSQHARIASRHQSRSTCPSASPDLISMEALDSEGYLEVGRALRYAQDMSQPQAPPRVYQSIGGDLDRRRRPRWLNAWGSRRYFPVEQEVSPCVL